MVLASSPALPPMPPRTPRARGRSRTLAAARAAARAVLALAALCVASGQASDGYVANCPVGFTNVGSDLALLSGGKPCFDAGGTVVAPSRVADCPPGYTNMGLYCGKGLRTKGASSMTCNPGEFKTGVRCYRQCQPGCSNLGEVCQCPPRTLGRESLFCNGSDRLVIGDPEFPVSLFSGWCLTPAESGPPTPAPSELPAGAEICAKENGTCSFAGTRTVYYGWDRAWTSQVLTGGTPCTNGVFGDPIPGVVKACYVTKDSTPAGTSSSCGMTRGQPVYPGCGFVYQSAANRRTQCGGNDAPVPFIYDDSKGSSCGIARGQMVYLGCGFIYQRESDRTAQCGRGGAVLPFIPAE